MPVPSSGGDGVTHTAADWSTTQPLPGDQARFAPGQIFAKRYRIVILLGRGAMGEVYRADDLRLGQRVALKLLGPAAGRGDPRRFISEVRLARAIAHPNVCRVYDIDRAEGWHYLSMEFVDGETLASLLRRIGRLPAEKALDVAHQLCQGLAAAHDRGVLHRDIKPSNIMIDGAGRVRLMDFGLAVPAAAGAIYDGAGTPAYMAPEQIDGGAVTERTDIYALGLVLHEVFTGSRLVGSGGLDTLSIDASMLPENIAPVIRRCVEFDPARRPASALAVTASLPGGDPFAAAVATGGLLSPPMIAAAGDSRTMRPRVAWALFATVVAGVLVLAPAMGRFNGVTPTAFPKPMEVLYERAREVVARAGEAGAPVDEAGWFDPVGNSADGTMTGMRFVYRRSPEVLAPGNLFHVVTETDPPPNVPGMATVVLDPAGRLLEIAMAPVAGRDPHAAAAVDGVPIVEPSEADAPAAAQNVFSSRRADVLEAELRALTFIVFIVAAVLARGNVRRGEGDLIGARRVAIAIVVGSIAVALLRAHHVPRVLDEMTFLFGVVGWSLQWGGFGWVAYVGFEPTVRRSLPNALVSWTRLIAGDLRDPLVGRHLLIGFANGVGIVLLRVAPYYPASRSPASTMVSPRPTVCCRSGIFWTQCYPVSWNRWSWRWPAPSRSFSS